MSSAAPQLKQLPRFPLGRLPTPLHALPRLTEKLGGPALFTKRDDLTGLATGGNKTRKLEFLIADALEKNSDTIITAGGPQSNHCRQTAAAAAIARLKCHLVLGGEPQPPLGNLLLDRLLGAEVHWTPKNQRNQTMADLANELEAQGRRPYVIPIGGSNAIGAVGYVHAMMELADQLRQQKLNIDRIVLATSSGGTHAGMVLGAKLTNFRGQMIAISIDQTPEDFAAGFCREVLDIAAGAAELLGAKVALAPDDIRLQFDYLGAGYGVVGELERQTICEVAQTEGLLVGPVYTSRAMGAMLDLIRRGEFDGDENVLFWHTGDESALHAYAHNLI